MNHTEKAPAKINLYLNVTARRADGFHNIETVMQTIDLYDTLHFSLFPAEQTEITLRFSKACDLPTDDRNLIVRAAKAFLSAAKKCAQVKILLEKKIPMAAGLAGGSADAAATLRALDSMLPGILTREQLFEIAASLGSDIPFCLLGGRALCYGRGEILEPISARDEGFFGVLANTDEVSSTPKAYGDLDRRYHNFDGSVALPADLLGRDALGAVREGVTPPFYNIFEEAVLPLCPRATEAKALLSSMGAEAVMMSGSGPSVFALTKNEALAEKMQSALAERGYDARRFSF
ncbi:MAG: 4-(cytidine 5'-diphospho)-2-C-methyl-D-erythritol kinase [Clostridia bacterium]|nr:4-(cytidine 5'-diphospho)-2-C-methyl-D-erythritol kinase [Clostridia bacterium]